MGRKVMKKQKRGGLGKFLFLVLFLAAIGGVAFWYFAPEAFNEQLDRLRGMLPQ